MKTAYYLVRSKRNPHLILTTSGEFIPESLLGPGGRCAKLYKTLRGAMAVGTDDSRTVHSCNAYGVDA
jgi:hypothetical protein